MARLEAVLESDPQFAQFKFVREVPFIDRGFYLAGEVLFFQEQNVSKAAL